MNNKTSPDPTSAKSAGTLAWLLGASALHVFLWMVVLLYFYFEIPLQKELFADFGVDLPEAAILTIQLSDLIVMYWYLVFPAALIAVIGGNAILLALVRSPRLRLALLVILSIPPIIWVAGCHLILEAPFHHLMQELH